MACDRLIVNHSLENDAILPSNVPCVHVKNTWLKIFFCPEFLLLQTKDVTAVTFPSAVNGDGSSLKWKVRGHSGMGNESFRLPFSQEVFFFLLGQCQSPLSHYLTFPNPLEGQVSTLHLGQPGGGRFCVLRLSNLVGCTPSGLDALALSNRLSASLVQS